MTTDAAAERYHRRRRWPILLIVLVLLVGTGVLWFSVLKPPAAAASGCNEPGPAPSTTSQTSRSGGSGSRPSDSPVPSAPRPGPPARTPSPIPSPTASATTTLGTFVAPALLAATRPADPATVALRVVNASTARGQSGTVTKDLQGAGFASIDKPDNDSLYPARDLVCASEIRFGPAGLAQARTVLFVAPCAQLVMDNRIGQRVDLALGRNYRYLAVSDQVKAALAALHDAAAPAAVIEGQTAAPKPLASIPPLPAVDCAAGAPAPSS